MPLSILDLVLFVLFCAGIILGYTYFSKKHKRGGFYFLIVVVLLFLLGNAIEHDRNGITVTVHSTRHRNIQQ